jgi:small-conductance mechanosensitive channel
VRATTQPFKAGEWITIDGVTGEVVDLDAFAFRLQEVDMAGKTYQFTGRTITVPNSKLFTHNIENANFFKAYIFEDVRIAVQYADIDPAEALDALKDIAEQYFAPYRDESVSFNRKIRRRAGVDIGSAEPVFDLTTSELGHYQFHVRFFLPTAVAPSIGSDVTRDFLTRIHVMRGKCSQKLDN